MKICNCPNCRAEFKSAVEIPLVMCINTENCNCVYKPQWREAPPSMEQHVASMTEVISSRINKLLEGFTGTEMEKRVYRSGLYKGALVASEALILQDKKK